MVDQNFEATVETLGSPRADKTALHELQSISAASTRLREAEVPCVPINEDLLGLDCNEDCRAAVDARRYEIA